jgi:hypothetical protein
MLRLPLIRRLSLLPWALALPRPQRCQHWCYRRSGAQKEPFGALGPGSALRALGRASIWAGRDAKDNDDELLAEVEPEMDPPTGHSRRGKWSKPRRAGRALHSEDQTTSERKHKAAYHSVCRQDWRVHSHGTCVKI